MSRPFLAQKNKKSALSGLRLSNFSQSKCLKQHIRRIRSKSNPPKRNKMATATKAGALKKYYPLSIKDFNVGATVGTGSFARVRVVTHKVEGSIWAVKILKKVNVFALKQIDHVLNERQLLERLHHPFIVDLAGTFQDEKCLYMVLEFVLGGEFYSFLRSEKRLDSPSAKFYATQVILFLEYIHSQDVCYRDLKPENILLDKLGYIKIVDFGMCA